MHQNSRENEEGACPRALVVDSCENAPGAQCLWDQEEHQFSSEWIEEFQRFLWLEKNHNKSK